MTLLVANAARIAQGTREEYEAATSELQHEAGY
jgi:hypothetical protein